MIFLSPAQNLTWSFKVTDADYQPISEGYGIPTQGEALEIAKTDIDEVLNAKN